MMGSIKLVNEIVEASSTLPIECQEHILDVIKAMSFTRKVIKREQFVVVAQQKKHKDKKTA